MKYVLFLLLSLGNLANAATVMEWQEATFTNLLKNPGFENGSAKWTPSVSSTFQIVSGTQALIETRSASFTATAASQTVQTALYPIPKGLENSDCESQILYQTNSNVYRMRVLNASGAVISQQNLPAVSNSTVAKMFFPCSVSATTSLRADIISSATAGVSGITWDQNHLGSLISLKNGAIKTALQPYTPTFTGLGTVTNTSFQFLQDGDEIRVIGVVTAGTTTAAQVSVTLPTGMVISSKYPARRIFGKMIRDVNTAGSVKNFSAHGAPLSNLINVGITHYDIGAAPTTAAIGTDVAASGNVLYFDFTVSIEGLSASNTTFDSRCPNDISCTNEFSAFIGANGAVSGENLDWIASCTNANPTVCTLNTGVFSVVPVCNAAIDNLAGEATVTTISPTSIAITTYNSGGAATALAKVVKCSKQGADFKAKQTIEGFLSKQVTSTGNFIERMERVRVVGTTENTNCTTSPCTILRQSGGVQSVTRAATGQYAINFFAGTFSDTPICTFHSANNSNAVLGGTTLNVNKSNTVYNFSTVITNTAAATDAHSDIICVGPR